MTTTLTVTTTTVALPDDFLWRDEHDWQPVEQAVNRSLTGALIIDVRQRLLGRPITLEPPDEGAAWMTRGTLAQLQAWAAVPGQTMTLSLRGATYTVMWRHHEDPALSAKPVIAYADFDASDFVLATLKLMVTA